ncbi:MAG: DUF1080 domain-containing protein [Bryobacteraceae bacterium]
MLLRVSVALVACVAFAQESPQPRVVSPGRAAAVPPSDALILFNGESLAHWIGPDGATARCALQDRQMVCASGTGDIRTRDEFQSFQLHLEFAVPDMPDQKGQLRGNSGLYLQGRYELQILDSYDNATYAHGHLGGLYGQAPPLVNAARPPTEWQTYDVVFHAPVCDASGKVTTRATVTAFVNGLLVQDHVSVDASEKLGQGCGPGPILLQDHSGFPNAPHTVMRFRDIWLRPLPSNNRVPAAK